MQLLQAGKLEDLSVSDVDIRGTVVIDGIGSHLSSEIVDALQRGAVRALVQQTPHDATQLLEASREVSESGAKQLLAQETLTEGDLEVLQTPLPLAEARMTTPAPST